MYEAREQENILAELQDESTSPASKIEGSFEYDMLSTNSIEFAKIEVELEQAYKASFAESSWGEYLTMRAAEFGVDRKEATNATGTVTLTGRGECIEGSRFTTTEGTVFIATKTVRINGTGEVPVKAQYEGSVGNVEAGAIRNIPMNIPGITAVTNTEATQGGYDEETDEELLERYFIVVRTPATSGNKWHYYNWAMSIEGVGACRVIPLAYGNGTVRVVIIDSNHQTASEELRQTVFDYIESVRPIGATVYVETPDPLPVTITADIKGNLDVEKLIEDVNAFLASKYLSLEYISYAQIVNLIMDQKGVEDCDNVLLNGEQKILVGLDKLPAIEEVVTNDIPA